MTTLCASDVQLIDEHNFGIRIANFGVLPKAGENFFVKYGRREETEGNRNSGDDPPLISLSKCGRDLFLRTEQSVSSFLCANKGKLRKARKFSYITRADRPISSRLFRFI